MKRSIVTKLAVPSLIAITISLSGCGASKKPADQYHNLSATQIYDQAKQNIAANNFPQAIEDLESLEANYPYGKHAIPSQLDLINSYYKNGNYVAALANISRFMKMHPHSNGVARALYLKGLVLHDQAFTFSYKHFPLDRSLRDPRTIKTAFDTFKTLVKKYPNSKDALDAKQKMHKLHEMLGNHELHIAKYYMKRKAYIAVVNRAQGILTNFKNTPAAVEAVSLLADAYNKLGMHKLEKKIRSLTS